MADNSFILTQQTAHELRGQLLNAHDKWTDLQSRMANMRLPKGSLGKQLQAAMGDLHHQSNEKQATLKDAVGVNIKDLWDRMMKEYDEANRTAGRTFGGSNQSDTIG